MPLQDYSQTGGMPRFASPFRRGLRRRGYGAEPAAGVQPGMTTGTIPPTAPTGVQPPAPVATGGLPQPAPSGVIQPAPAPAQGFAPPTPGLSFARPRRRLGERMLDRSAGTQGRFNTSGRRY